MLRSASDHYKRQQRITAAALVAARKAKGNPLEVAKVIAAYQLLAARDAVDSFPAMLEEQGITPDPVGSVAIAAFSGSASDGRSLVTLFEQASSDFALDLMIVTQIQDTARAAASTSLVNDYAADGYVRMLNPPSCSRCAVLAGKWFRWNQGFKRHPKCDCRHVPSRENIAGDLRTDPGLYFDSLSPAEQNRIFTNAGAQAIRDGADISQVVNVRRGMNTAQFNQRGWKPVGHLAPVQIGRRDAFISTEGTTDRGLASRARTGRNMSARLMPESIYAIAKDRDDALRMLRLHGYLI